MNFLKKINTYLINYNLIMNLLKLLNVFIKLIYNTATREYIAIEVL